MCGEVRRAVDRRRGGVLVVNGAGTAIIEVGLGGDWERGAKEGGGGVLSL